jgi:hypothetical protein
MAKASGVSLGAAMGDWLLDTVEAAEMTASMIERAREAPRQVIQQLNALALGLSDEAGVAMKAMRGVQAGARAAEPLRSGRNGANPPSSNTGGKGPVKFPTKGARS